MEKQIGCVKVTAKAEPPRVKLEVLGAGERGESPLLLLAVRCTKPVVERGRLYTGYVGALVNLSRVEVTLWIWRPNDTCKAALARRRM